MLGTKDPNCQAEDVPEKGWAEVETREGGQVVAASSASHVKSRWRSGWVHRPSLPQTLPAKVLGLTNYRVKPTSPALENRLLWCICQRFCKQAWPTNILTQEYLTTTSTALHHTHTYTPTEFLPPPGRLVQWLLAQALEPDCCGWDTNAATF